MLSHLGLYQLHLDWSGYVNLETWDFPFDVVDLYSVILMCYWYTAVVFLLFYCRIAVMLMLYCYYIAFILWLYYYCIVWLLWLYCVIDMLFCHGQKWRQLLFSCATMENGSPRRRCANTKGVSQKA